MSRSETEVISTDSRPQPATPEAEQLSLFSSAALSAISDEHARWSSQVHDPLARRKPLWKKDFTTVSGMEVNPLATPDRRRGPRLRARSRLPRRVPLHARHPSRPAIAASSGPCASSPASARRSRPTSASSTCSRRDRPASPSPSICRRSTATTPTITTARAKSASAASPSTRSPTWRRSSTASTSRTSPSR